MTTIDQHISNIWKELESIIIKDPQQAKKLIDRFNPPMYLRQMLHDRGFTLNDEVVEERGSEYDTPYNSPGAWDEMEEVEEMHDLQSRAGIEAMDFHNACGDR
jgi:hypothetical protein